MHAGTSGAHATGTHAPEHISSPPWCSALAHLASASGVSREREEFMELVENEIQR